jgi:hypothetical protein
MRAPFATATVVPSRLSGARGLVLRVSLVGALAAIAPLLGCAESPPLVGGYPTVYAEYIPPDIYGYPHVWYDGSYAYLVGDRWYYPSRAGWVLLRQEPIPLYRYRADYRYRTVPPYGRTYRQAPPPPYRPVRPPPPPARVR